MELELVSAIERQIDCLSDISRNLDLIYIKLFDISEKIDFISDNGMNNMGDLKISIESIGLGLERLLNKRN
jgi:hypothetical protein